MAVAIDVVPKSADQIEIESFDVAAIEADGQAEAAANAAAALETLAADWEKRGYRKCESFLEMITSEDKIEWLIHNVLVRRQSATLSAVYKGMKTTNSLLMGACLATGLPYLGFETTRSKVFFASAESGRATLRRNLIGILQWLNIDKESMQRVADENMMSFQYWVPRIANAELLEWFAYQIDAVKPDVVFVDPLFQTLDGETQANLSMNAEQIEQLVSVVQSRGATLVVNDHIKRSSTNGTLYKPIQLGDISGAGKAEYFRQWILMNRRSLFDDSDSLTKRHELWLTCGGSAGHSGTWALDIDETFTDDSMGAVNYDFRLRTLKEMEGERTVSKESKDEEKRARKEERLQKKYEELIGRVFKGDRTKALTKNDIEGHLGLNNSETTRVIAIALDNCAIKLVAGACMKNRRSVDGYMLSDSLGVAVHQPGTTGNIPS